MGNVRRVLDQHQGILTAATAGFEGLSGDDLTRAVQAGVLVRVCRGGYLDREMSQAMSPEQAHSLRARAVLAAFPADVALSHHSAACAHGLPWIGRPPAHVHLVRRASGGHRRTRDYTVHVSYPGQQVHQLAAAPALSPAWLLPAVAHLEGVEQTVVLADAALHAKSMTMDELDEVMRRCRDRPGARCLAAASRLLDPAAESAGESRCRLLLGRLGHPVRSQVTIVDRGWSARVDFLLEKAPVVVEFDGASKYAGFLGAHALVKEKYREDRLRSLGYEVVRLTWSDLSSPAQVDLLLNRASARARGRVAG